MRLSLPCTVFLPASSISYIISVTLLLICKIHITLKRKSTNQWTVKQNTPLPATYNRTILSTETDDKWSFKIFM